MQYTGFSLSLSVRCQRRMSSSTSTLVFFRHLLCFVSPCSTPLLLPGEFAQNTVCQVYETNILPSRKINAFILVAFLSIRFTVIAMLIMRAV